VPPEEYNIVQNNFNSIYEYNITSKFNVSLSKFKKYFRLFISAEKIYLISNCFYIYSKKTENTITWRELNDIEENKVCSH